LKQVDSNSSLHKPFLFPSPFYLFSTFIVVVLLFVFLLFFVFSSSLEILFRLQQVFHDFIASHWTVDLLPCDV